MPNPTFPQPMSGDFYFFPWNGSSYDPAWYLEASVFDVDSSDVKTNYRYSRRKATYMTATQTVVIPQPFKLTVELDDRSSIVAAMMFRGTEDAFSFSSGAISAESITAKLDRGVQLANYPITAATVVVKNSGGSTTYVENTDYTIDYDGGILIALSTGAITDSQALKVDYTHSALTGRLITGGAKTQLTGKLLLLGQELANTAKKGRFEAAMATIGPAGAYDLMNEAPQVAKLTGSFQSVSGAAPFTYHAW
jgi:hypothetical protein